MSERQLEFVRAMVNAKSELDKGVVQINHHTGLLSDPDHVQEPRQQDLWMIANVVSMQCPRETE